MAEEKKELIFVKGISCFKPRETAPKSVKGNVVITLKDLREFIKENNITEQIRIDLRYSEGKEVYYFTLNTWKPAPKEPVQEF